MRFGRSFIGLTRLLQAAPPDPPAFPASLRVGTWNANHWFCFTFDRRESKVAYIISLLRLYKPQVFLLQETGRLHRSASEEMSKAGYDLLYAEAGEANGVAILVEKRFKRLYGCVADFVLPGHIVALRSTRKLRFVIVNTYFSSMGATYRKPQYQALHDFLRKLKGYTHLVGGDQNRVDGPRGRWYPPRGDLPSRWGDYCSREMGHFRKLVLHPFHLGKVPCDHLGFRHRQGLYFAELDSFYAPVAPTFAALYKASIVPVPLRGFDLSDHDPLFLTLELRSGASEGVPAWACEHERFPEFFAARLNAKSRAQWGQPVITLEEGVYRRTASWPSTRLPAEYVFTQEAAVGACRDVRSLGRQVLCRATTGVALGLLRRQTAQPVTQKQIQGVIRRSPALLPFFELDVDLSGSYRWRLDVSKLRTFVDEQLSVEVACPSAGTVRRGRGGVTSCIPARKARLHSALRDLGGGSHQPARGWCPYGGGPCQAMGAHMGSQGSHGPRAVGAGGMSSHFA